MKFVNSLLRVFLVSLLFLQAVRGMAQVPSFVVLDRQNWRLDKIKSVAYDAEKKKAYAGLESFDGERRLLVVFDIAADGTVEGAPRRYVAHSGIPKDVASASVNTMLLDTRHRKLFMGIVDTQFKIEKPLVVYDLDAAGEPTGVPRSYDSGNPRKDVQALALHPTLNRLYLSGWGAGALYVFDLDEKGEPSKAPVAYPAGDTGKYSLAVRGDGSRIYMGSHPSVLEVGNLDANGHPAGGGLRSYKVPNGADDYLRMVANDRAVYFKGADGGLGYFALDAKGEPGVASSVPDMPIDGVALAPGRLLTTSASGFKDAFSGKWIEDGVQIKQFALGANGGPGPMVASSPILSRRKTSVLGSGPAAVLAVDASSDEFIGNRFAGLRLRATVSDVKSATTLPVAYSTVNFGFAKERYLRFAHSARYKRVYIAGEDSIVVHSLAGDRPRVTIPAPRVTDPLLVDDTAGVLYAARKDGAVLVFKLDATGTAPAEPETLPTGIAAIAAMAANPVTHHLYVAGKKGDTEVSASPLPGGGKIVPLVSTEYMVQLAVDAQRGRIYGAGQYSENKNLWIWKLGADGLPAAPARFDDGLNIRDADGTQRPGEWGAMVFDAAQRKLYLGGNPQNPKAGEGRIVVYDLNPAGDPAGAPRAFPAGNPAGSVWSLALAPGGWLYETGFRDPRVFGHRLNERGELTGQPTAWPGSADAKINLTVADNTMVLGTYPGNLEVFRLQKTGEPAGGMVGSFALGQTNVDFGSLHQGEPTPWVALDDSLKNEVGNVVGVLNLKGAPITSAMVKFEVEQSVDNAFRPLKTLNFEIAGNRAAIILPRYGSDTGNGVPSMIKSSADLYRESLVLARKYALKPEERPRQFIIANGLIGLDSSVPALDAGLETLQLLGHNTIQAWGFDIAPGTMRKEIDKYDFTRFRGAVYTPPTYFDSDVAKVQPDFLDQWAAKQDEFVTTVGAKTSEMALFHMADEPAWYFPQVINEMKASPEALGVFRKFLQEKKLTPAQLGGKTWEDIVPIGRGAATTLPRRRLHYWTVRFFPESMSRSFAAATAALQRKVNPKLLTTTNLANWPARILMPSPGKMIAKNEDTSPDAGMGAPDWFDLGRKKAVSCMWTEDWFDDSNAQTWSLYSDLLRCAAREGDLEFGSFVIGHTTGSADGGKYKIMSLAGHGAKVFDPYMFGPWLAFSDGWSQKERVYQSLAGGMRILGKSEKLLYPGRPHNGNVAILAPQASQVWDVREPRSHYLNELYGLHAALMHANYAVDFVDDTGLEDGNLTKYKYSALYITGPNLSVKAQQAVIQWVRAGGTVVLMPGAAAADEYNEPTDALWQLAGAGREAVERLPVATGDDRPKNTATWFTLADARLGTGSIVTLDQVAPLTPQGAGKAVAQFADGKAAIVAAQAGAGKVFSFGYWPGVSYWNSPDRSHPNELPKGWAPANRNVIAGIAGISGATRPVTVDGELVEAALLESKAGLAVTLLNWSGSPQAQVTVTIPTDGKFTKIESAERGVLPAKTTDKGLAVTLPLDTVDVLMLTR